MSIRIDVHCHLLHADAVEIDSFVDAFVGSQVPLWGADREFLLSLVKLEIRLRSFRRQIGMGLTSLERRAREALGRELSKIAGQVPELRYLEQYSQVFTDKPERIVDRLLETYAGDEVDLFVPLMTDYENWLAGEPRWYAWDSKWPFHRTSRVEWKSRVIREHAGQIHLFAPFCPIRAAVRGIEREVDNVTVLVEERGFLGVKIYPLMGYYPCDNALRSKPYWMPDAYRDRVTWDDVDAALEALYARCEAQQIPITAHTSPHGARGRHAPDPGGDKDDPAWRQEFLGTRCQSHPLNWSQALADHPGLRLNFAHMAGDHFHTLKPEEKGTELDWAFQIVQLMSPTNHVYADRSCQVPPPRPDDAEAENEYPAVTFDAYRQRFIEVLGYAPGLAASRIMNGSDWHLLLLYSRHAADLTQRFADLIASDPAFPPGFADGFLGDNAARFLGLERGDPAANIPDGRAVGRLADFYEQQQAGWRPDWWDRVPIAQGP